jgi:hypothetical protein
VYSIRRNKRKITIRKGSIGNCGNEKEQGAKNKEQGL